MGRKQELQELNLDLTDFLTAIRDRINAKLDELVEDGDEDDDAGLDEDDED